MNKIRESSFLRFRNGQLMETSEVLVRESSLELWFEDIHLASLTCSPGDREHLALGYLLTSGLISSQSDIELTSIEGNRVEITASSKSDFVKRFLSNQTSDSLALEPLEDEVDLEVPLDSLRSAIERFLAEQSVHEQTGGVHGALIHNIGTNEYAIVEDIGRFNAVDKVVGIALKRGFALSYCMLLVSGRLTSEMVSKAVRARIPIMGSFAIATDLGIHVALNAHLTLLGRLKDPSFWLYNQGHAKLVL